MEIRYQDNNVIITNIGDFSLRDTFLCGQVFRFTPLSDNEYLIIAGAECARICQNGESLIFYSTAADKFESFWRSYFDFDRDYTSIRATVSKLGGHVMEKAAEHGRGIRILKQDLWETIISFIISANNNIPRIQKIITALCENFGNAHTYEGKTYYSFPDADSLAHLSVDDLSVIRAGFRAKYILSCAKAVASGEFDINSLHHMPTEIAGCELTKLCGVGPKVRDCILLFALSRFDVFPVDVWIGRIVSECYFDGQEQTSAAVIEFAKSRFGDLCGIAQQYLFHYARNT